MDIEKIGDIVIGKAIKVHTVLGPGLLESTYCECLKYELVKSGLTVAKEVPQPIIYESVKLDHGYRIDLLIENKLVVEIKSVEAKNEVHIAQTLTYLILGEYRLGLLLNFNVKSMKNGIRRVIN